MNLHVDHLYQYVCSWVCKYYWQCMNRVQGTVHKIDIMKLNGERHFTLEVTRHFQILKNEDIFYLCVLYEVT